jgi:hypothetical protein
VVEALSVPNKCQLALMVDVHAASVLVETQEEGLPYPPFLPGPGDQRSPLWGARGGGTRGADPEALPDDPAGR